ncbi:M23 family metallopeptidase [Flexilinea flocculi]|uniref:Peptidase family M23 n=1 Tax=Flexilinea flocculi TaxID=1678840 RepID=A0A0S7BJK2_9CHLR|nr:M23 family metallopeptidase [Flexilinea flocculi]GAP40474.1 peptidase family M23 [Flexilinea flocculi]
MERRMQFILFLLITILNTGFRDAKMTETGFYWPTGSEPKILNKYNSSGCKGKEEYISTQYHIGVDIDAEVKDPVYPIADGKVISISKKGWGNGNVALLILHQLSDGKNFIAVYGHIKTELKQNDEVKVTKPIGTIGDYDPPHLHLSIFDGVIIPNLKQLGMMPCPKSGESYDMNGSVDPIVWITTKYPEKSQNLNRIKTFDELASWIVYGLYNNDISVLEEIIKNATVAINTIGTHNFIVLSKKTFLDDIQSRLTNPPECVAISTTANILTMWFKNWSPPFKWYWGVHPQIIDAFSFIFLKEEDGWTVSGALTPSYEVLEIESVRKAWEIQPCPDGSKP